MPQKQRPALPSSQKMIKAHVARLREDAGRLTEEAEAERGGKRRRAKQAAEKAAAAADELAWLGSAVEQIDAAASAGRSLRDGNGPVAFGVAVAACALADGIVMAVPAAHVRKGDVFVVPADDEPADDEPLYVALSDGRAGRGGAIIRSAVLRLSGVEVSDLQVGDYAGLGRPVVVSFPHLRVHGASPR